MHPSFFTCEEIEHIRTDARRQANRFAADYPDYVETLEDLYQNGGTASMADLKAVRKPLRHRRKRKHAMAIALKWSILDDDDDDVNHDEEDYNFDDDVAPVPVEVDHYASDKDSSSELDNEVFCHVDMRGLELRVTQTFRHHRKQAVDAVLHLQRDMKLAGCCPAQIEMGLRAKAVQFSNRTKQFAAHQAQLDRMELDL